MKYLFILLFAVVCCAAVGRIDATRCVPLSKFKIDCNTCFCSSDPTRFACSTKSCRGEPADLLFINDQAVVEDDFDSILDTMSESPKDATHCEPLSQFKKDCNTCICSSDLTRFVCTKKSCKGGPVDLQFMNDQAVAEDDFDAKYEYPKQQRIRSLNDELPPSEEELGNNVPFDDEINLENDVIDDDSRFERRQPRIQYVDLDEQEAEEIGGPQYNYRSKRDMFI